MPDWTKSMAQSFEYYIVDPVTWTDSQKIDTAISCTISRDITSETLGSASFDIDSFLGECYIRVYLATIQNGLSERFPLGTFLVQTPSHDYDSKVLTSSITAYTPLIELKEKYHPIGYTVPKGDNVMKHACALTKENVRAPVVTTTHDKNLTYDFTAGNTETMLSFNSSLIANAGFHYDLDEMGNIMFAPDQTLDSLQPRVVFHDGNSSILYPDVNLSRDFYGIPNVIEVVYSTSSTTYYSKAVNNDPDSPTSIQNRGRVIMSRVTDPDLSGVATQAIIDEYAQQLLKSASSITGTISYSHGYYPIRVGDCVQLEYRKLKEISPQLYPIKARVTSQSISCTTGCPVEETAEFNIKFL